MWMRKIKNCSVHTQTAWKLDQKASVWLSLFLSETDFSQYVLFSQLTLFGPALLCAFSNTQQSAVRAGHEKKTKLDPPPPPKKNNLKTINWKQYSFKKLIWWGNWPCSSAVEVSHTAHCYHIPTAEKKLTHQEMIVRGLILPLCVCVCVCVCVCGGGYGGDKEGGGGGWLNEGKGKWVGWGEGGGGVKASYGGYLWYIFSTHVDTITSYHVVKSVTDCLVVVREEENVCMCVYTHTEDYELLLCFPLPTVPVDHQPLPPFLKAAAGLQTVKVQSDSDCDPVHGRYA